MNENENLLAKLEKDQLHKEHISTKLMLFILLFDY